MSQYCGEILTIKQVEEESECYLVSECGFAWTDEMIECKVEEETKFDTASNPTEIKSNANCLTRERVDALATKIDKELPSGNQYVWELPDGYQFVDEKGNVINATQIVLEKKKKEYPKTYEECCEVLGIGIHGHYALGYKSETLSTFQNLIICRNAYWKIAGEQMGLGKPWEPSGNEDCFVISRSCGEVYLYSSAGDCEPFEFPTPEMRDAFKENFDPDIEICKEFL